MPRRTNLSACSIIAVFLLGMVSIAGGRTIYVDSYGAADFIIEGRGGHAIAYIISTGPTTVRSSIS